MGWWGPNLFSGDAPLDLLEAFVRSLEDANVDVEGLRHPEGFCLDPDEWDDDTVARLAAQPHVADVAARFADEQSAPTDPEKAVDALRASLHAWRERGGGQPTVEGPFPMFDPPASLADERLDPATATDEQLDELARQIAAMLEQAAGHHDREQGIYATQVAAAFLLAAGVTLPDTLRDAALAACDNDPWASGNPARQAVIDRFATAIRDHDRQRWSEHNQTLAESFDAADHAGVRIINQPGTY